MSTPSLLEATNSQLPVPSDQAFINMIERASSNADFDATKLEKLLEMYERIMARNAEMAFNSAFADMQSEMPVITERGEIKDRDGNFRSGYAFFEDINDEIKPILKKHGFAIMFKTKTAKDVATVTPILIHKDGHREVGEPVELGADTSGSKNSVQSIGSSVSYAKRYGLLALLNITTRGEDDDGQAGGAKLITDSQAADLRSILEETKTEEGRVLKYASSKVKRQVKTLGEIPASIYTDVVAAIRKQGQ